MLPPVSAVSPLLVDQFSCDLRDHSNPRLVAFILDGLCNGFKLGFNHSQKLKSTKRNKPSAYEHPTVIDEYLANEVSLGRVLSPFNTPPPPFSPLACEQLWGYSKKGSTRKIASKAPAKRSQHANTTCRNIVGRNMLRAFGHRVVMCCDMLGVVGSSLTSFKLEPTTPNMLQHDGQTHATCCAQQCCDMLRWHFAIVWPGLNRGSLFSRGGLA